MANLSYTQHLHLLLEGAAKKEKKLKEKTAAINAGIKQRDIDEAVVTEVSADTLGSYKKKAGKSATALDNEADAKLKAGDTVGGKAARDKAHKRFKGINQATKKEFSKAVEESKKAPSSGLSKKEKSAIAKKTHAGKDIGKKGKNFDKVAKAAGGGEKGKKIAAASMWKNAAKHESTENEKPVIAESSDLDRILSMSGLKPLRG